MPSRSLSFFAVSLPLLLVSGSVPFLGFALSLEFAASIWAVAGFRYFLLATFIAAMSEAVQLFQWTTVTASAAMSPAATAAIDAAVKAGYGPEMLLFGLGMVLALPLLLYGLKRIIRKKLIKRMGAGFFI